VSDEDYEYPVRTLVGVMWKPSVGNLWHGCDGCPYEEECRELVAQGDFVRCEVPLQRELLSEHQLVQDR